MTDKEALEILIDHQKWRRAMPPYDEIGLRPQYTAKQVGEAIDIAIKKIQDLL